MAQHIETREQLISQISLATQTLIDLQALSKKAKPSTSHAKDLKRQESITAQYLLDLEAELKARDEARRGSEVGESVP